MTTEEYRGDEVFTGPSVNGYDEKLHEDGFTVTVDGPITDRDRVVVEEVMNQMVDRVVNAQEPAEATARRYARQLLNLQEGLIQRGVDLGSCTEEQLVDVALACLDEAVKAAHEWERTANGALPGDPGLVVRPGAYLLPGGGQLKPPPRREGKSLPPNVDLGPDEPRIPKIAEQGWTVPGRDYPRGVDELLEFGNGIIACASGVEGPEPVAGWNDAVKRWSAAYHRYLDWYVGGPGKRTTTGLQRRAAAARPISAFPAPGTTMPPPAAGASAIQVEHMGIGETLPQATIAELARQQRERQMWNQ